MLVGEDTPPPPRPKKRTARDGRQATSKADFRDAYGYTLAMPRKPTTIDEYLATVSDDRRRALERLRKTIRAIVPEAKECISYRIPAFRLHGVVVAGFLATAKGCSYFPFSGSTLGTLARQVRGYDQTRGSLHFSPDEPLPASLVRRLIDTRIAETKGDRGNRGVTRPRRRPSATPVRARPQRPPARPSRRTAPRPRRRRGP